MKLSFVIAGSIAALEEVGGSDSEMDSSDGDATPGTQSMESDGGSDSSSSSPVRAPLSSDSFTTPRGNAMRSHDREPESTDPGCGRGRGRGRRGRGLRIGRGARPGSVQGRGRGRGCGRGASALFAGPSTAGPSGAYTVGGLAVVDVVSGTWTKQEPSSHSFSYCKTPGPTSSTVVSGNPSALDLFCRYFTDDVWDLVVVETNRYASSIVGTTPGARPWTPVTVPEMKAFIGILILMGILKLPRLELYWSTKNPRISTPGISSIMSRVRFEQLFRCLHLTDNAHQTPFGQPGHDRLYKVRKLLNLIVPLFESEYEMHQQCTIDEAMIPFKGRLGFKQYMKDKPTKWGIKVFVLADATNGYVKTIQIYTGKSLDSTSSDIGLCTKVVLDLMSGLEHTGLHLYTDNYYTSPNLYLTLYNNGINACGTARVNRRAFPKELTTKATKNNRGHYDYRSNGPLLASVWVDKRSIYFVSTIHPAEPPVGSAPSVKRRKMDGTQEDVPCPPLLPDYQAHMRGVDRGDQLISYYNIGRRSKKWWKRVFYYILECALLNSFVLDGYVWPADHARLGRAKRDILEFRLELANELIGSFSSRKRPGRQLSSEHAQMGRMNWTLGHWPEPVERKSDCVVCAGIIVRKKLPRSGNRHESRTQCSHCKVHLCVAPGRNCFKKYHTCVNYCQ